MGPGVVCVPGNLFPVASRAAMHLHAFQKVLPFISRWVARKDGRGGLKQGL